MEKQWIAYEVENIEYVKTSNANNVNLYYSLDNGLNWSTITTGHDGGTYSWTIPNYPSEDVLIKVQDEYTSCRSDLSDTVFTILSSVEVISPNGGQIQAEVGVPFGTGEYYMDNVPVVTDGGYFYDSGGPTSNYGSNENYYKTFYPETPGNKIRIKSVGNSSLGDNCGGSEDRLRFYHGPSNFREFI